MYVCLCFMNSYAVHPIAVIKLREVVEYTLAKIYGGKKYWKSCINTFYT